MGEELDSEVIKSTQDILGKYVTKPPLTEKLLRKPPFRFLHDVINTVIKETGFLKGLFSEGDLLSDNVKDRDSKIAFLNKLISAIKTITGVDLPVRASKIIAGLEAEETNKLLQAIGTAIDDKKDSKEYVRELKEGKKSTKTKSKESSKQKKISSKGSLNADAKDSTRIKKTSVDTPKNNKVKKTEDSPKDNKKKEDKTKGSKTVNKDEKLQKVRESKRSSTKVSKDSPKEKESPKDLKKSPKVAKTSPKIEERNQSTQESPKDIKIESPKNIVDEKPIENINENASHEILQDEEILHNTGAVVQEEKLNAADNVDEINEESPIVVPKKIPMERPKSARPRSGDFKKEVPMKAEIPNVPIDIKPEKKIEPFRPKSSLLRPPSVRPSSARPGAPRLRPESALPLKEMIPLGKINVIIENYGNDDINKDEDEEETVVIQNIPDDIQEPISIEQVLDIPAEKGHLVEQILEQIHGEGLEHVKGSNIDWEQEGLRGRDAATKEISTLRASIQALTKTANPLGKLMSYLHEDVEAMHSELDSWTNMKRQFLAEITKQKRINNDSSQPLKKQLDEIEDNIKKQREQISTVKFNILRNDSRIRDLIDKQVTVQ